MNTQSAQARRKLSPTIFFVQNSRAMYRGLKKNQEIITTGSTLDKVGKGPDELLQLSEKCGFRSAVCSKNENGLFCTR